MDFLKAHQKGMEHLGFWTENNKNEILKNIELQYKKEVIKEYTIVDFIINENKVLIKWIKRFNPLTDEELKDNYGI